ncbi:hypothetical protein KJA17_00605 [Patescibacteria group bacterium]|nr:hypothetical protein [Patescibacteria group bacterium]
MDVIILVQELEANWQWCPHGVAVGIGSALCIIGVLLVAYFAPWVIFDTYNRITRWINK